MILQAAQHHIYRTNHILFFHALASYCFQFHVFLSEIQLGKKTRTILRTYIYPRIIKFHQPLPLSRRRLRMDHHKLARFEDLSSWLVQSMPLACVVDMVEGRKKHLELSVVEVPSTKTVSFIVLQAHYWKLVSWCTRWFNISAKKCWPATIQNFPRRFRQEVTSPLWRWGVFPRASTARSNKVKLGDRYSGQLILVS